MSETDDNLARIAAAIEQLGPPTALPADWMAHPAYVWSGEEVRELRAIDAPALAQLRGIDRQKSALCDNIARLALGHAAHDMLLWGARGMGKSALLRAAVKEVQAGDPAALGLVQVAADALGRLPDLFHALASLRRHFVIFIDDLGFADDAAFAQLARGRGRSAPRQYPAGRDLQPARGNCASGARAGHCRR